MNRVRFPGARKIATLGTELTTINMFSKRELLRIGCSPVEEKMKTAAIDQNESAGKQTSKHIKTQMSSFSSALEDAIILKTKCLGFGINFTGVDNYVLIEDARQIGLVCTQCDRIYLQKQTTSWCICQSRWSSPEPLFLFNDLRLMEEPLTFMAFGKKAIVMFIFKIQPSVSQTSDVGNCSRKWAPHSVCR